MHKYIVSIAFYILTCWAYTSHAQVSISDPHKPLITKATATWCGICGFVTFDKFKELINTHGDDAIFMAMHADEQSGLYSETAKVFSENLLEFYGVPELFHGHSPAPPQRRWENSTKEYVEEFNGKERITQSSHTFEFIDNSIKVELDIKYLKDEDDPRYLSLFLIENDVVYFQFNKSPQAVHSKILRTHITPEVFGNLISTEPIKANDEFAFEYSKELDDSWKKEDIEVALVIWKYTGKYYQVINSSLTSTASNTTPTSDLDISLESFKVSPSLLQTSAEITIHTKRQIEDVSIDIYNNAAQKLKNLYSGLLKSGKHTFMLDKSIFPIAGIYFVSINDGRDIMSKKIIVE